MSSTLSMPLTCTVPILDVSHKDVPMRLLNSNLSESTSSIVSPDNSRSAMATTVNTMASNSFTFESSKTVIPPSTCNICSRLLYSFEEILICRACHGSYHWRCVKPETISHYGDNENYICEKCTDGVTSNPANRIVNNGIKIKSTDSIIRDYRDLANIPSKINASETNVLNAIRYFEEKQQQSQLPKTAKASEIDAYLPLQMNETEYNLRYGQYNDGSRITRQIQQQQQQEPQENGIATDNGNDSFSMFQANYQYTPLKDFAAMSGSQTTDDRNINNGYQSSPSSNTVHPITSRYGGGLRYINHGYDPTVSRLVEAPLNDVVHVTSPTVNNLSFQQRQNHFISTTNININENNARRSQQQQQQQSSPSPIYAPGASPYVRQIRDANDDDTFILKSPSLPQEQKLRQSDRNSIVESDSGIVMVQKNMPQQEPSDNNQVVERKFTDLVQQLEKQLENDSQKMNEKLESKLKKLEDMINQQTYVIRQQDDVIERLKTKISKIEIERDNFRDRLFVHEKREQDVNKNDPVNETYIADSEKNNIEQTKQSHRIFSNTSTSIENSKLSIKKTPAPRVNQQRSTTNNENELMKAKTGKNVATKRERQASDSSSVLSGSVVEKPAASSRLDSIIRQTNGKDDTNRLTTNYSLAQVRRHDRTQNIEPISAKEQVITTVHHTVDNDDSDDHASNKANDDHVSNKTNDDHASNKPNDVKPKRRDSSSSSSSSQSSSSSRPTRKTVSTANVSKIGTKSTLNKNLSVNQSLESVRPSPYGRNPPMRPPSKSGSLESGSIYTAPVQGTQPAFQTNSAMKGWLRKQNRSSIIKRIERYYCVLNDSILLMYRHENDTMPQKAINLNNAKVLPYDDPKHGSSLELTWLSQSSRDKHYHLYPPNMQEAQQWATSLQIAISDMKKKNDWRPYRLST